MEPLYALYQQLFRRVGVESEAEFQTILLEENVAEVLNQLDEQDASASDRQVILLHLQTSSAGAPVPSARTLGYIRCRLNALRLGPVVHRHEWQSRTIRNLQMS